MASGARGRRILGGLLLGATLLGSAALAQVPGQASLGTQEDHPTLNLPEPQPHWVYILEPVFPHLVASKIWILDGDTLQFKGMVNGGYTPNLALSPDRSAFYLAETYWSRGSRGDRTDVVTFFDPKTLEATGEVKLPQGRFLVVPKKNNVELTTDGRYLVSYNMAPSMGLSLVDVKERRYVGEIESGGCSLAYPTGPKSVAMLCPDGSLQNVVFDEQGKAVIENGQPFFDSENDPVFEHAALHRPSGQAFFISYDGWVYPTTLKGKPVVGERWKLQAEADQGWRPGGWQVATFHAPTNRLFVLMHEGDKWTHKQAGHEVWVYDVQKKQRLQRIPLAHHSISLNVSQDDKPLLFALSETATVEVLDGTSYQSKGVKEGVGISPFLLYTVGE
jgi:methylamine dehydrogenase heavy chain